MKELILYLDNEKKTVTLGYQLANICTQNLILYLYGDLGSGKTTFSRGFIKGKGYQGYVKSPTYTLIETYLLPFSTIYHFDLYRLNDPEELEFIGIRDYFNSHSICLIEWPNKGNGMLASPDLNIYLLHNNNMRQVRLISVSTYGYSLLKKLSLVINNDHDDNFYN
ncbi:tRNA threonylcarbamoyladenosine biosynthesis protein TsaE [Candidatus Arsenophonus lipoptenae]|uniref:tRNA threonylcarbamoyladenosine biosynthesis protein TsaE n=1 Tax=Candidatus Arsenophonus lipoptenae TaxID=634113 RepID=A0A0X9WB67_9GAMM|nr:tRNA (adenosine(37)-N6)-threonylcarbamoyltransferase complex ATPase subunit type 1 TsaE [Candidatus Arsenophonus lipoptenae]AMA65153.1 tRNA threonylcarbamoyladenosine biosynthesis protein TsaE [Candidatus Arsenophonus lipoptenae]